MAVKSSQPESIAPRSIFRFRRSVAKGAGLYELGTYGDQRRQTDHWGITEADMAAIQWAKPTTVVEVAFVEWTADGLLRHSRFVGVRDDKRPSEVRRERT
jgi:ATP dependent DNA ligase-like protein